MKEWQSMTIDEVIKELGTNPHQGLSVQEAHRRLEKQGFNEMRTLKKEERRRIFSLRGTIITVLSLALLVSLVLKMLLSNT